MIAFADPPPAAAFEQNQPKGRSIEELTSTVSAFHGLLDSHVGLASPLLN